MERDKALEMAMSQIDKQFGKGSVMRMGETTNMEIGSIPTGALALDLALGIGGLPRGRIVELYGPESSGKCLVADTHVWTDRGLETVAEIFARCGQPVSCTTRVTPIGDLGVRAVNERGELESVTALTHNDLRPVLRLKLESGREVTVTHNHPLRVVNERGFIVWREAGEIRPGDAVVSALFGAVEAASGDGLSEDEAVVLGYLVAGGSLVYPNKICFSNGDADVSDEYTQLVEQFFGAKVCHYGKSDHVIHGQMLRTQLAEEYGLDYVHAAGKTVPSCIRTGGHKIERAFLSALFEGDGSIDHSSTVGLGTASEQLARQVQLMLYGFGISCMVCPTQSKAYARNYWSVTVNPASTHRFMQEIGFRSQRRKGQIARDFRPPARDGQFENSALVEQLNGVAGANYTYEPVVSIEDAGFQPTFDLVLPKTHSFVANGILSHNTTLAMHVVAEAQRNGGIAAYIDAEHSVDPVYAEAIGVNVEELLISQPDTGEQALEITDMLIRSGALDVVVIDSVAALTPRAEIEGEMGDSHVGLQARLMSQALRKLTANLNRTDTICLFINQLREKIGISYGSPEVTPGGRALKFYSSVRLDIRRIESIKDGIEVIGNRTRVKVVKNKVSSPFKLAEFDIMYGKGISREGSMLDVGVDLGLIKKSGAWYTYEGEQLGQGRENAKIFLAENPELMVELSERIRQAVGLGHRDAAEAAAESAATGATSAAEPAQAAAGNGSKVTPGPGERPVKALD